MLNFTKKEMKIFFTLFIIYFIFINWYSQEENSFFDLTRAIIDEGRLEIDSYYNNTVDRSTYNQHYYSNKIIGLPLNMIPIYTSWKFIDYNILQHFYTEDPKVTSEYTINTFIKNINIIDYITPSLFLKTSMILVVSLTSCLFTSLTILLLYKLSNYFTKDEKYRILIVIIYGLGTLAFPYASVLYPNSITPFFIFLSFYLLFKTKMDGLNGKYIVFAGLASGYAFITDYLTFTINLLLLLYLLTFNRNKKVIILFLIANMISISALFLYNYQIFKNPFESIYKCMDITIWNDKSWILSRTSGGFSPSFEPFRILRLLVFPHIGLFFYYPVLILSVYGLVIMDKKYKVEKLLILSSFLSISILVSMYIFWYSATFGARYLLIMLPFFVLPILFSFKKINLKIVLTLLIISILVNCLSTVGWSSISRGFMEVCCFMDLDYINNVNTLKIISNPLFKENIFYFFESGPRSRLIESFLVSDRAFDIRNWWPSIKFIEEAKTLSIRLFTFDPFGFLSLKTSFITTLIIVITIFLIWRKDMIEFVLDYKYFFIILCLLSLLYFLNISNISYTKHWFEKEIFNGTLYRWMSDNSSLAIYTPKEEKIKLRFGAWAFYRNRTMEVYLNNELIDKFNLMANTSKTFTTQLIELSKGENIIRFHSLEGCDVPSEVNAWDNDYRCLSVCFFNVKKLDMKILYGKFIFENWYDEEKDNSGNFRWMGNESNITYYTFNETNVNLTFSAMSYYKNRELDVFLNDAYVKRLFINTSWSNVTIVLNLSKDENIIKFHSVEGCDVPKVIEQTDDNRCLSFAFRKISL